MTLTTKELVQALAGARAEGYAQAVADIVAMLKTGRTVGGETITSAKHAAVVIERGDAKELADQRKYCPKTTDETKEEQRP